MYDRSTKYRNVCIGVSLAWGEFKKAARISIVGHGAHLGNTNYFLFRGDMASKALMKRYEAEYNGWGLRSC